MLLSGHFLFLFNKLERPPNNPLIVLFEDLFEILLAILEPYYIAIFPKGVFTLDQSPLKKFPIPDLNFYHPLSLVFPIALSLDTGFIEFIDLLSILYLYHVPNY